MKRAPLLVLAGTVAGFVGVLTFTSQAHMQSLHAALNKLNVK